MAKFISYDGTDTNGIRAEVSVMTGTGRIKEINGRGKAAEDGSYRNVEVVFDPDNPHLKRKVYALLDTTATDLTNLAMDAHKSGRDISFRIESQRKRGVDRTIKFEDLVHTEQVVRVLAGIDGVFSHEAKTNPAEDPSSDNPSALDQAAQVTSRPASAPAAPAAPAAAVTSLATAHSLVRALAEARRAEMPTVTVDTLAGLALAAGAPIDVVASAGFDPAEERPAPSQVAGRGVASEEKPWSAYNSDGRVNAGSYMVRAAARAEQFSLDHLRLLYSEGKKAPVDVVDPMIAQASSLAFELLDAADEVQAKVVGRTDRQKNSYSRALDLVTDTVAKRYPAPLGGNDQARTEWRTAVVAEAAERLYGVLEVAQGRLPLPEAERAAAASAPVSQPAGTHAADAPQAEPAHEQATQAEPAQVAKPARASRATKASTPSAPAAGSDVVAGAFAGATVLADPSFTAGDFPAAGADGFEAPTDETIAGLRDLCVAAGIDNLAAISAWLERVLGVRRSREVHAPALAAFVAHYQAAGPNAVRAEVLGEAPSAA